MPAERAIGGRHHTPTVRTKSPGSSLTLGWAATWIPELLLGRFAEIQDEDLAVRVEAAAGGGLGLLYGILRQDVSDPCD